MYPNLFKNVDLPKLCSDISQPIDSSSIEVFKQNMPDNILCQDEEEKYPELSVKTFFDFMRTAYQVNESFEELACTLSENSEIDWTAVAKINLNLEETECDAKSTDDTKSDKKLRTIVEKEPSIVKLPSEAQSSLVNTDLSKCLITPRKSKTNESLNAKTSNDEDTVHKSKSLSTIGPAKDKKELSLSKVMKRCLSDVFHEGLLDSVIPYMLPKQVLSQPIIKKTLFFNPRKTSSLNNVVEDRISSVEINNKEKDKEKCKQKKIIDNEVEIHVYDEAKNIKKNFYCPQRLLVQKMCYFSDVTAGQRLEDMDISVHCDVAIFDWLMRWVKKDIINKSECPVLEANNVIPIMVSASFLQMEPLLESCLIYCHNNMSEITKTATVLSSLNDNLLTKLSDLYTNTEVEAIKDKKDKIQSRLFCKLILALGNPIPDNSRGHFGSLATLFKCAKCEKNVVKIFSHLIPCVSNNMKIDNKGNFHSKHTRDMTWNLNDYIISLRSDLRSWRKIYWRLWGDCHFLFCRQCGIYFPINQMDWCAYHPENPQFFINEQQRTVSLPLGRFPCCSQRAYKFQPIVNKDGCRFREHVPDIISEKDENIFNIFLAYRKIISLEPPHLFFPEKITRLVTRDPSLPPGKLSCKEIFWWEGIEIVPPRQKLGLLAKIWGGSGINKPCQSSQKIMKKTQASQSSEICPPLSLESYSDEDDGSHNGNSSLDDESFESEQSRCHEATNYSANKTKTKFNIVKRCDGMGAWSSNLSVRYNQDNQRDFEEKAVEQMITLLTKRAMLEYNLHKKSHVAGKHNTMNNNSQLNGGLYARVELEFLNQFTSNNKCKNNVSSKGLARIKSSK